MVLKGVLRLAEGSQELSVLKAEGDTKVSQCSGIRMNTSSDLQFWLLQWQMRQHLAGVGYYIGAVIFTNKSFFYEPLSIIFSSPGRTQFLTVNYNSSSPMPPISRWIWYNPYTWYQKNINTPRIWWDSKATPYRCSSCGAAFLATWGKLETRPG